MARMIARTREHLSTLEALATSETKDPALYNAEQVAYRRLDLTQPPVLVERSVIPPRYLRQRLG
jgi:hypothetical protein